MGFKVQLTLQTYLEIMIRTPDKFQGLKFKLFPLKRGAKFGVSALKYIEKLLMHIYMINTTESQ